MEEISYDKIQSSLKLLIENYDMELVELSDYKNLYDAYKIITYVKEVDQTLLSSILVYQYRPSDIKIGTLGSFLFGCMQDYYGETNKECSPLCIENKIDENTECEYQVWIQMKNNCIEYINNSKNSHAYIYLLTKNHIFESKDIEKLRDNGVKYAQLVLTKNSKHELIDKLITLDQLPVKTTVIESIKNEITNYKYAELPWFYIIIILIIIMIFIFTM